MIGSQPNLFSDSVGDSSAYEWGSPAAEWAEESAKHALDDLFNATFAYRSSKEFYELMQFVKRFRFYSPYNAFLIHIQRPGATFVAPAFSWNRRYGHKIKPNANPLVILQPMGPVMFVFDVSDTEPGPYAKPLPKGVLDPFAPAKGGVGAELEKTIDNAKRDGIRILPKKLGSQAAGSIQSVGKKDVEPLRFQIGSDKKRQPIYEEIPVRYEMLYSQDLTPTARYATIVHELAHLYCGHLGTPNKDWWPDRSGLSTQAVEFEAESVTYLVCERLGVKTQSERYLSGYVADNEKLPKISLECIMKAAGLIESMGRGRLKRRKASD